MAPRAAGRAAPRATRAGPGAAGRLAVICSRWLSSSAFDGCSMNLATSWSWCCAATRPCCSHTRRKAAALRRNHSLSPLEPSASRNWSRKLRSAQAVPQALLVLGPHEEHLLDQELRVVRVVPAAEPEQEVDLVDAGEVAGVRPAVLLAPDAVRLVVRPHAVEEAIDVELGEEHVVEAPDVLERVARVVEERLRRPRARCRAARCA